MVKFKKGAEVKQITPAPIQGSIESYVFDETSGDIHVIIKDASGQTHTFHEDEVEAVEAEPEAA